MTLFLVRFEIQQEIIFPPFCKTVKKKKKKTQKWKGLKFLNWINGIQILMTSNLFLIINQNKCMQFNYLTILSKIIFKDVQIYLSQKIR